MHDSLLLFLSLKPDRSHLGKITSVFKDLYEAIFGQSLVLVLFYFANDGRYLVEKLFLSKFLRINVIHLGHVILSRGLTLFHALIQERNCFSEFFKVYLHCLFGTLNVERELLFAVAFHGSVQCG